VAFEEEKKRKAADFSREKRVVDAIHEWH